MKAISRYLGCMLGLATGDALGASLECKKPGSFVPIADLVGGGPFDLQPGQWTDDTALALCLADSLIQCRNFNSIDQLERYLKWYREGYMSSTGKCFGIGKVTQKALLDFEGTHKLCENEEKLSYSTNGSLMRLAPVPLYYASDLNEAIEKSGQSSLTTHCSQTAVDACRYFGALLVKSVRGLPKSQVLSPKMLEQNHWAKRPLVPEIQEVAQGSFRKKNPPEIVGSGNVVKSLEAALWAFSKSSSFEEGCCLAVNLGNDADTTGAIFGQIAGAYYGIDGIPKAWLSKLAKRTLIEDMARKIFLLSRSQFK